jgi:Tol biopolymer transport system component/DNA-binding winged helix-turn-helix (wHTH) protein
VLNYAAKGKLHLPLSTAAQVIRFGSFEVDLRTGELRRNGLAVRLQGQPFQILAMLLEHPGELVPREDIRRRLWPADTFVDFEHSLNAAIKRLREALGESAEKPVFIETLPRRGYRIRIPVHSVSPATGVSESHSVRPRAWGRYATYLVGGLTLLIVSYMGLRLRHGRALSVYTIHASTPPMRVIPFTTTPGAELEPTFSPDGKAIAFLWDQGASDKTDLYVKLIGAEQPLRITHREGGICNAAWSPDGRYLAFQSDGNSPGTFIVPALTGPERKVSTQATCLGLSWSPDGKYLAFPGKDSPARPWRIATLSLDTLEERWVTFPEANIVGDHQPCFAPDSKTIAYMRIRNEWVTDLYMSSIEGGEARRLTYDNTVMWGCSWARDGQSVVISSHRGGDAGLWRVSLAGGSPERLAVGSPTAFYPAISAQGDRLAYRNGSLHTNIWHIELDGGRRAVGPAKPLMRSNVSEDAPQFSPDGTQVAFSSQRSGSPEVWVARADGTDAIQLTSLNNLSGSPRWSPDGKFIAFDSRVGNHSQIFVIRGVGGAPRQLTTGDFDAWVPSWSRDGQWIYFASDRLIPRQLFKISLSGGEPIQVTSRGGSLGFESRDGSELIYCKDHDGGLWKMPLPSGPETRILDANLDWGRWALHGNGIYFIDATSPKPVISLFDFATQTISRIATVEKALYHGIPAFDVSPDARTILFAQVEKETDIMLVENFH